MVTGLLSVFIGSWPFTQLWIWLGLALMVIYSVVQKRVNKPARQAVAEGENANNWVCIQLMQVIILMVGFIIMGLKPF